MYRKMCKALLLSFPLCLIMLGRSHGWNLVAEFVDSPGLGRSAVAGEGHTVGLRQGVARGFDHHVTGSTSGKPSAVAFSETAILPPWEYLWAGVNNGDIFDEPGYKLDEMLRELAKADLRVVRIWIDLRLEMDENGNPLPPETYDDCLLEAIDTLMVKAKNKGILLLITLHQHNWLGGGTLGVDQASYGWRRCKTPEAVYATSLTDGTQYVSDPYYERGWGTTYITSVAARDAYKDRVDHILNHVNPHFGKPWKEINDVVWAWGLQNEPEYIPGWGSTYTVEQKRAWFNEMASHVKGIDPDTYVALGTKYFSTLTEELGNIEDADIYTVHGRADADSVQVFQETIGQPYGKLLLLEEFWFGRGHGEPIESISEVSRANNVPWMFWEYGYNFDSDDLWHADGYDRSGTLHADGVVWDAKVVPAAKNIWRTAWNSIGVGKTWKVHEMVDSLCSAPDASCEDDGGAIYFLDTFSGDRLSSGYRWFDEGTTDAYSLTDEYLRIDAHLFQDLWGGAPLKTGAPLMLRAAPEGDYWVETFVTADPAGNLYSDMPAQGINTQTGLFVFQDVDNWIFFGLTNHDFPGAQGDGLIAVVTEDGESRIVAESEPPWTVYGLDYAFLRVEKSADLWCFRYHGYSAQTSWSHFDCVDSTLATRHEVGMGVKTLDVDLPLSSGEANFDYFLLTLPYSLTMTTVVDAQSGDPGEIANYVLRVINTGNTDDSFSVTVSGNAWSTTATPSIGPVAAGDSATVDVTVSVPLGAAGGATDAAVITVTSQGDDARSASATLTTTAGNVYGVGVVPASVEQSGAPGETVTCTLRVTNTGNTADTFGAAIAANTWSTTASSPIGSLTAGAGADLVVTVSIPPDAVDGVIDTATVTITSQGDNTKSVTATLTTTTAASVPALHDVFVPIVVRGGGP